MKPKWDEKFTFEIKHRQANNLQLEIWDEDTLSNDFNAGTTIPLSKLCVLGGTDEWHEVFYKEKGVGKIHIGSIWMPEKPVMVK